MFRVSWNSITGATWEASPSTNMAMGIPRFAALTCPAACAPITTVEASRRSTNREISPYASIASHAEPAATSSGTENTRWTSASDSVRNSSGGEPT